MDIFRCTRRLSLVMLSGLSWVVSAQEKTAHVPQMLPFASAGVVTTEAKSAASSEGSTASAPVKDTAGLITQAGGRISTAQDSTTSLVIGTLGSARMGADSEVKVPDAGEGGHSLELLKGQLFMNISADELKQRNEGEFKLKTPAALLAVKGTKFFTLSGAEGDTIGVHHGTVLVTEPESGQSISLDAGYAVTASSGALSEPRPLTNDETKLAAEYDLAALRAIPLPVVVYDKKNDVAMTFREGRVVKVNQPAYKFSGYEPCVWLPSYTSYIAVITGSGHVEFSWNTRSNESRSSKLSICLRGRGLEKTPISPDAPPLLKPAALRFRYRAQNVQPLKLVSDGTHAFDIRNGHGSYNPTTPRAESPVHLIDDNDWHEMILPLRSEDFLSGKGRVPEGWQFATEDIGLALDQGLWAANQKNGKSVTFVLQLKDFELLTIP